jgi:iron complex transport system permease protein
MSRANSVGVQVITGTLDRRSILVATLCAMCIVVAGVSFFAGAYRAEPQEIAVAILGMGEDNALRYLIWHIRMPRILLGVMVGGGLALAGACIQGLFRNPLAEPSLIGVTSGAMLFAAAGIVLGAWLPLGSGWWAGAGLSVVLAFAGSLLATLLVYRLASWQGRTQVTTMLLAGIAVTALAGAGTGLLTYFSSEEQLRDLTFWTLGSLAGGTWKTLALISPLIMLAGVLLLRQARALDLFLLGEQEAAYAGLNVQRAKRFIVCCVALIVGCCVAVSGVIAFVALVAPHLTRLLLGASHRYVLPAAMALGAVLIMLADMAARTLIAPAELPIGVLTALLGAPFFLWLLRKNRARWQL